MELLKILNEKERRDRYIIAFTGNKVAQKSGIPTLETNFFGYTLQEIFSVNFMNTQYDTFLATCKIVSKWIERKPNNIHSILNHSNIPIITENIDGLHLANNENKVIELLGNIKHYVCTKCDYYCPTNKFKFLEDRLSYCPVCNSHIKLNIILLGEPLQKLHLALNELYKADTLIVLGSELRNWPINRLINIAEKNKTEIIIADTN